MRVKITVQRVHKMSFLIFLAGVWLLLLASTPLTDLESPHVSKLLQLLVYVTQPSVLFPFIFNIRLIAVTIWLPLLWVIKVIMNSITSGNWIFPIYLKGKKMKKKKNRGIRRRRVWKGCNVDDYRGLLSWVSIKRSQIVYIYSNKRRRNLGFTAVPPLSASRTKTRTAPW